VFVSDARTGCAWALGWVVVLDVVLLCCWLRFAVCPPACVTRQAFVARWPHNSQANHWCRRDAQPRVSAFATVGSLLACWSHSVAFIFGALALDRTAARVSF
jgi:hypothetical protein